jgi:predicted RNA-binding Zn ribbon-like protein
MVRMDMTETDLGNLKLIGGWLCLDFTNTVDCRNSDHSHENLSTYQRLVSWSRHANILTEDEARHMLQEANVHPTNAKMILERAITIREALYRIFSAIANNRPLNAADINTLNTEMSISMAQMRLKPTGITNPWKYTFEEKKLDRMLWLIIHSATELLTSDKLNRVCECQGENCGWLFLDMSRNRSRKWCDMKDCGNRAKAQRHYQITRAEHSR